LTSVSGGGDASAGAWVDDGDPASCLRLPRWVEAGRWGSLDWSCAQLGFRAEGPAALGLGFRFLFVLRPGFAPAADGEDGGGAASAAIWVIAAGEECGRRVFFCFVLFGDG
jgi:hypothetical protein